MTSAVVSAAMVRGRLMTVPSRRGLAAAAREPNLGPLPGGGNPLREVRRGLGKHQLDPGQVDLDAGWGGEDEVCLVVGEAAGAVVVDEEVESVGGLPEVSGASRLLCRPYTGCGSRLRAA